MNKYINIHDKDDNRNVSLSINKLGQVTLLGALRHGSRLTISPQDAKALIELLKPIINREA